MVNVRELVSGLKGTDPPFACPLCEKVYKSWCGIEYHLLRFPHEGVERSRITSTPASKRTKTKKGRGRTKNKRAKSPPPQPSVVRETLTYAQAQKMVEFDFSGHLQRLHIGDSLGILEQFVQDESAEQEETDGQAPKSASKTKAKSKSKNKSTKPAGNEVQTMLGLPKPEYSLDEDACELDAPPRCTTYFRFIERTSEELDEEVEYSADDEDAKWLKLVNEKRKTDGLATVSQDVFELLMDRLEKESHFESQNTCDPNQYIDEDAVCCICNDGECANSNVILFCDMCNLAVHQECYGVPYIPEGQWLCRRCLNSPSRPVDCVLCPNKTGAFKQTDDNRWAHVVCALWIPEVCFANTVFLEPIDSLQNIPAARWKLRCYICRKTQGACIQCSKINCYTAFHVTCAQQAGLHLKIEPTKSETGQPTVKKSAFCDQHSPNSNNQSANDSVRESDGEEKEKFVASKSSTPLNQKTPKDLKEIRKRLSEKHPTVPIVNIPFVPAHRYVISDFLLWTLVLKFRILYIGIYFESIGFCYVYVYIVLIGFATLLGVSPGCF